MTPTFPVRQSPPFSPPDIPVDLLDGLATALEELGPVFTTDFDALTMTDMERALNSLAPKEREVVMRGLSFRRVVPRRFGAVLTEQILKRVRGLATDADRRHVVGHITERVRFEIYEDLCRGELGTGTRDLVGRWGATLLRLAVFNDLGASAREARLVHWLLAQELLQGGDEVFRVAGAVIDATPGFLTQYTAETDPARSVPVPTAPEESLGAEAQMLPTSTPTDVVEDMGGLRGGVIAVGGALQNAHDELTRALGQALPAAHQVREALAMGTPPDEEDLDVLTSVRAAFSAMDDALREAGVTGTPPRLDAITEAVRTCGRRAQEQEAGRDNLRKVLTLSCSYEGPVADILDDAHARADRLLDKPVWEDRDRTEANFLALLVELVALRDAPQHATRLQEIQTRIAEKDPKYAVVALLHQQIVVVEHASPAGTAVAAVQPTVSGPAEPAEDVDKDAAACAVSDARHDTESAVQPQPQDGSGQVIEPVESGPPAVDSTSEADRPGRQADQITVPPAIVDQPPLEQNAALQDLEVTLARLVHERRFGLAAQLSQSAGRSTCETGALRMAAMSNAFAERPQQAALGLELALRDWETHDDTEARRVALLMLPVLVRTALLTGLDVAGAHLRAITPHLPETLQTVASAVAERTLSTALLHAPPHTVISDVSETENRLRDAVEHCRAQLTAPRMNFQRASRMAQQWLKPHELLGGCLTAIVQGASDADDQADRVLEQLSSRSRIESVIDSMDAALRGSGGSRIDGVGRNRVRQFIERVRESVSEWRSVRRTLAAGPTQGNAWAYEAVTTLRKDLLALRTRVEKDLKGAGRSTAPMTRAAALHARVVFAEIFTELEQGSMPRGIAGSSLTMDDILDAELLKIVPEPGGEVEVSRLLLAVDRSWDEAFELQVRHDGFAALRRVIELADAGLLPDRNTLTLDEARRTLLEETERGRRESLAESSGRLAADLRRAQADGTLTVEQDVRLQEILADAELRLTDHERCDLGAVRVGLDQVTELLPGYRKEAAERLRRRLDSLTGASGTDRDLVLHNIKIDNLAVAAELVYFLELGQSVPDVRSQDSHLEEFFPQVPDALSGGLDPRLVEAVRTRARFGECQVLDYTRLTEEEAARAARVLEGWQKIATVRNRAQINPREDLNPALSLVGYEAKRARPLTELPYGKDYRFFELAEVEVTGRAWAPAFGSQIADNGRKLRALLIWDRPTAELLHARIAKDRDENSLLVVHFGTMSARTRTEFAAASQGGRPVMVVDDAALAYLAAQSNRQADTATKVLLPFSSVNPYIKEKRGQIGWEMFYGRDAERQSIIDPKGTQIIYGGRGLGKSALLADAGERFEKQSPGQYRKLYVNLDKVGISSGTAIGAEAIWPTLERSLIQADVLTAPTHKERRREAWQRVTDGIAFWLREDSGRRLLILLDECDRFFEADAPEFTETRRLRGLGEDSRGSAKVVFAGLHSVQRFTRIAGNTPFSHLAQTPTVIGPLTPQFAADLIVEPMRALGFEFDDLDLVNQVLGFCSYQPFLLQIFGSRMVQVMQSRRARQPLSAPPYFIGAGDVAAVEQDASLRSDINAAFKDTLDLDDRYTLIANVLAQHARDNGLDTRLSDRELHDECAVWWPQGFERLHSNAFRTYLEEMVGLGVLAPNHDGRGWHLRGPNALRMIGTAQEIEARLAGAERDSRLEDAVVLESRPLLQDGRSAPLTISQIDYLLGSGENQVRTVLGSRATGIGDVEQTLRFAAGQVEGWAVPVIGSAKAFRRELEDSRNGERRLLVSDLTRLDSAKSCRESLSLAREQLPTAKGATRSVVLVSGTAHLDLWQELAVTEGADDGDSLAVVLRRYDARDMKRWAQRHSVWETAERLDMLGRVTGGWPVLLGQALELYERCRDQDRALEELSTLLAQHQGAEDFVEAVGVLEDQRVRTAYFALVSQLGTEWNREEDCWAAGELAGLTEQEARGAIVCLTMLHALERDGARLRPEPVLQRAMGTLGIEV